MLEYLQLTAVPEEMTTASNALSVRLATKTARLAKDSGQDVTGKAASAFVDVVGQVSGHHRRFDGYFSRHGNPQAPLSLDLRGLCC